MNLICFPNVIQLWSLRVINVFLPFMASICSQYKVDHKYWLWNLDAWQQLIYKVSSTGLESLNGSHASISHLTAVQTRLTICLQDEESKALWDDGLPGGPLLPTAEMGSQQSGLSPEPVVSASAQTERSGTQRKKTKVWQAGAFPFCVMLWGEGEGYMWVWICKGCTLRPENIRCPALSLSASLPWDHISHYIWHVAPSCSSAGDWQAPATLLSLPPSVTAVDMQEAVPDVLRSGLDPHSSCWDSNCPSSWIISLTPKTLDLVLLCLVTTETERTMVLSQSWWCMLFTPGWQRWAGLCGAEAVSVCVESSRLGKDTYWEGVSEQ